MTRESSAPSRSSSSPSACRGGGFLGRAGSSGLALTGLASVLAACGGVEGEAEKAADDKPAAAAVNHPKTAIGDWTFANWPLYIDKKVIKDFNKEFGGKCKYVEEINDNFEFFGKVRQQLAVQASRSGATSSRSPTTWRPAGCAWATSEPIDKKNVPNFVQPRRQPQDDQLRPQARVHAAVAVRRDGLGYNIKKTGRELKSIKDLFDPKFKGKVTMLSEPYDSASAVLLGEGVDASKATLDQLLGAIEKIDKANQRGPVPPVHRQRLHAAAWPRATSGSRSPTRATWCSCSPTTPTCASPTPRRAARSSRTT